MFAVYVALGNVEMLNYALRSVLKGEKKHFIKCEAFCFVLFLQVPGLSGFR